MTQEKLLTLFFAIVWFTNGFVCKVLNLVPRHEAIVARILGPTNSETFTLLIGLAEIGIAIWILTGFKSRINAILQMAVVTIMNTLEFLLAPDLLLWGKFNAVFAFLFILLIYYHEFIMNRPQKNSL
ncbi:MAG: DoxX-like family protein [Chitinophagales bacterium]|nr:DoxX-like family protein [Chitinophagales bacterium]